MGVEGSPSRTQHPQTGLSNPYPGWGCRRVIPRDPEALVSSLMANEGWGGHGPDPALALSWELPCWRVLAPTRGWAPTPRCPRGPSPPAFPGSEARAGQAQPCRGAARPHPAPAAIPVSHLLPAISPFS